MSKIDEARRLRPLIEKAVAIGLEGDDAETGASLFPSWSGDGIAYDTGFRVQYNSLLYRCILTHVSQADWTPDTAASLWVRTADPGEEWPEWTRPTGAHDAYGIGAKVSHAGKHWTSDIDANTYEPGVYGWTEAE